MFKIINTARSFQIFVQIVPQTGKEERVRIAVSSAGKNNSSK